MKRTLVSLLSLTALFSLLTLTSCQKEQMGNGSQFRATMEGCTDQSGKTVLDGTALNWVEGDQIAVYGTAGCGIYTATPQTPATVAVFDNVSGETGDGTFEAFYPATLTTDGVNITLPTTQSYVEGSIHEFPMYAMSNNQVLSFKNLCGVLKMHLAKTGVNISSITVTAGSEINGTWLVNYMVYAGDDPEISADYSRGTPMLQYVSGGTNSITLECATAQAIDNGADFYIYLPADSYTGLQIGMNTDDGRYCVKTANTTINVVRSQYTTINLGENDLNFVEPLPEGALPGLFSVSATQQVHFSQGNLYRNNRQIFSFFPHQYDYLEIVSGSGDYWSCYDMFTWSTDYMGITYEDWGVNPISNGGNTPNLWRTLSSAEWNYLLNSRDNAVNKYATGTVNNVHGLILLPDNWTLPEGGHFNAGTPTYYEEAHEGDWAQNTYTAAEWAEMEAAGAVFLPAAGTGMAKSGYGDEGYYWSSTQGYDYGYMVEASALNFSWYYVNSNSDVPCWYDYSIRLVTNAN